MLISYKCFSCETEQLNEDPPVDPKNPGNFMQWYFRCRCPNCNYKNIVEVNKPIQMQLDFPPFKLN